MPYVALRRLNVDGEMREPGDPVPEAASWHNLDAYVGMKEVAWVETDDDWLELLRQFDREGDMSDLRLRSADADVEHKLKRNMLPGEGTGAGTAPTADGQLRQPVAGVILERLLATSAGVPGGSIEDIQPGQVRTTHTIDQDQKRLATAAALGDEAAQSAMDAAGEAAVAQGEEFEQYVKDAVLADAEIHNPANVAEREGDVALLPRAPDSALNEDQGPRRLVEMEADAALKRADHPEDVGGVTDEEAAKRPRRGARNAVEPPKDE